MIPPHFHGHGQPQPPFAHLRHQTPSASPPMNGLNGMPFAPRGHTPQPQIASRPSSRNGFRRDLRIPQPGLQPVTNGYAYMPQPAIYNPQSQPNYQHGVPPPPPGQYHQYAAAAQQQHQAHNYMEDQHRSSVPPPYPPQGPAQGQPPHSRHSPPQPTHQISRQQTPHMSPPQPPPQHLEPPQQHLTLQHSQSMPEPQQPPAPMEPRHDQLQDRPGQPLLDTASAIKKLPQRKQHSIFTPIDENRSILSQHLASFNAEPRIKEEGDRSQSIDLGAVPRVKADASPPLPQRSNTSNLSHSHNSASTIPETTFTPPSRSNSLKIGGGSRPRLKVQIPEEQSEAGSNAGDTATSPRTTTDTTVQSARRNGDGPGTGVVLPPPSPSASAMLSAGATGPPNPFARPPPQNQNNSMNIDTPVSALPSRFLNNEFLPSPSSFYPEWNFRGNESTTLPSPLNFATPVVGSGPSFLRDENGPNPTKRKSPDTTNGHGPDAPDGGEPKRIKVEI